MQQTRHSPSFEYYSYQAGAELSQVAWVRWCANARGSLRAAALTRPGHATRGPVCARSRSPCSSTASGCFVAILQPSGGVVRSVVAPITVARGRFSAHKWPERMMLMVDVVRGIAVATCHNVKHLTTSSVRQAHSAGLRCWGDTTVAGLNDAP